jgi:cobalt/nickel transport system permease protein
MHIPDGYLSPQTYVPLYVVSASIIGIAVKKVKKKLTTKLIPFLGMSAAFTFLIMMFNLPIPGGTTGHAMGGAIIALLFGPWVATISISVALIIQAFVFGDGGITTLGANCFNMAIVVPFFAYVIFKLINGRSESWMRMSISAFLSGYISISVASIVTAVELGIQPILASSSDGTPLFAPYSLKIAVPAMAFGHLVLFGVVEGVVTVLLFRYFYKNNKELIEVLK